MTLFYLHTRHTFLVKWSSGDFYWVCLISVICAITMLEDNVSNAECEIMI